MNTENQTLLDKAKENANKFQLPFQEVAIKAYLAGAGENSGLKEAEGLQARIKELEEALRVLNAGMIHFSTLDKMPTLDLLDREGVIEHVVNIGREKVL